MKTKPTYQELEKENKILRKKVSKNNTNRYKLLSKLTFEGILIHEQGKVSDINQSFTKMFGYKYDELIGQNIIKLVVPQEYLAVIQKNIQLDYAKPYRIKARKKDGTLFHVEIESRNLIYDNEKIRVTAVRDILYRKEVESKIKKLSTVVEQSTNVIVITNTNGNIEYTNPKFTEVTGYTANEALGKNPRILKSGTQSKEYYQKMWQTIKSGITWKGKFHNKKKNGGYYWEQITITPIKDKLGEITNYLAVKEDITNLVESEERLSTFINTIPDIVCYKDGKGRWLLANKADLELFCLSGVDYFGKTDAQLAEYTDKIYKKAFSSCLISDEQAWKNKTLSHGIEIIPTVSGITKIYDVIKIPTFHSDGSRKGLSVIGRDITDRKKAEQELIVAKENTEKSKKALKHSHDLMEYIIEHNRSAVAVHDKNYKYIYVSQRYLDDYSVNEKNIIGKHHYDIFPDLPKKWRDIHKKALLGQTSSAEDDPYYKDDGTIEWTRWECRPWHEKDGTIGGFIVYTEVITRRKNMELALKTAKEKAEESNQLKTEFINNMSHEIRTPLNGILGFSKFLKKPNLSSEKQKNYINIIQNSGNQLIQIIDDILEISKLGTKQVKVIEKQICLNDLLLEQFSNFEIKAKENITPLFLNKGLSDIESIILTDEIKLNKIISKLLENALKFTNTGFIELGYKIKMDHEPVELEIYIKDTGIGIKPESQKIIFERFSQEEKSLSLNVGGLGLGLSIAKENTELLGGRITLKSEKGKGTTFFVTIPYKPVKSNTKNNNAGKVRSKKIEKQDEYTILIVEDKEVNYLYINTLLGYIDLNLKTLHAKHGKEAVEMCKENSEINFVLMDIKMPIMNGFEATKLIKEFRPDLPIVAQTAYSTSEEREQILFAGCDDFILKPISEKTLNVTINKYLIMKQ